MAYASQAGRARTSSTNPEAHAICDRCGFRYNFNDLEWQFDWRGATLQNIRILVCDRCLDVPQEQLRAITLPADPIPIINARVEQYSADSIDYMGWGNPQTTTDPATGIPVVSQDVMGWDAITPVAGQQPIGPSGITAPNGKLKPPLIGLEQNAQMPFVGQKHFAVEIAITSIVANGTTLLRVNCSQTHGLVTGAQVSISGVSNPSAWGFFTVTVLTATVLQYTTNDVVPAGVVSTSDTIVATSNAGVPWGF